MIEKTTGDPKTTMIDEKIMKLAIIEANKCIPSNGAFNVGAVLVSKSGSILSKGYSRELPGITHAEECCLLKLSNMESCRGGTIYTTMEPCGLRLSGNTCCAELIINAAIARVVQGVKEPSLFVGESVGTSLLNQHGVAVDNLAGFEDECLAPNKHLDI
jgi:pyrimidine deaminase RibD-like protein